MISIISEVKCTNKVFLVTKYFNKLGNIKTHKLEKLSDLKFIKRQYGL